MKSLSLIGIILFSLPVSALAQPTIQIIEDGKDIIIETDMKINLVLIGDTWSEDDKSELTNLLLRSYVPMISAEGRPAGVHYNFTYNFKSVSKQTADELFEFINSIAVENSMPSSMERWVTAQQPDSGKKIVYKLIDAFRVEGWLAQLNEEHGYTIFFLKPSRQQLGYLHTYTALTRDPDTGRMFVQEGMMGFGGKHRLYFIDLTAGPWVYPFIRISETNAIWEFHGNINDLNTKQEYYRLLSDYVNEAIMLRFTPSYLYAPTYSKDYRMEIFLIDMTSGRTFHDISANYISRDVIEGAFAKLIPYSDWKSSVTGHMFDSLPRELQRAVLRSLTFHDVGDGHSVTLVKSADLITELERWVKNNGAGELGSEQKRSQGTVVVPIILFVFDTDGYVDEIPIAGMAIPDANNGTLPCCALVAIGKHALTDYGTGLSVLTIHEMGHVIGLRHPHDGYSEEKGEFNRWFFDWSYTPMTYASPATLGCGLPNERCGLVVTEFGRFDIDAIDRGVVLYLLRQTQTHVRDALQQLQAKGYTIDDLPSIENKLFSMDEDVQRSKMHFEQMNYFNFTGFKTSTVHSLDDAFDYALSALQKSQLLEDEVEQLSNKRVGVVMQGTETLHVSKPLFVDENGMESEIQEIAEPITIKSIISNANHEAIRFSTIIQIKDREGYTIAIKTLNELSVVPNEKIEASMTWTFDNIGDYVVEVFVWTGFDDPLPLSPVNRSTITLVD
ncbi:MAG: hypothetical protein QXU32_02760 [Nitrososphaerales archaeon]